jgi:putative membrane protein
MLHHRTVFGLVLAAAGVAACSGKNKSTTDTTSTTTSTTTTASSAITASGTTPTPGATPGSDSASAPADPAHYTDANILAKEIAGDSGEVAIATMAKEMATNGAVKRYAEHLIVDHTKGQKDVVVLAQKLSITPQAAAGDSTTQAIMHAMTRLRGIAKGAAFDTAFVNHEIEDHQQDIKDAQAMSGAATDAQVKALVSKSVPELRKHLDEAQKLSRTRG